MSVEKSSMDMFGLLVGLQFSITELLEELSVDTIQENPRTVLLAIKGLECEAKQLVRKARDEMPSAAEQ